MSYCYCINPECRTRLNPDSAEICQNCGTSLLINNHDHPHHISINSHRYRIIKSLKYNPSTCTEIFEVEDLDPSESQKVKILKAIHDNDTTYDNDRSLFELLTNLFTREQNFLYFNHHLGIPRGYDIFSFSLSSGRILHCLVMEKIEGVNLEQWVRTNGAIGEKRALRWLKQIVTILNFVHEEQFFHRDIKPSNIMWRQSDQQLVLIDFGTVKAINGTVINQNGREISTYVGSLGYMAPEQRNRQAVPQSDFYSLGITFVYLLTSYHPQEIEDQEPISKWPDFINNGPISPSFIQLINDLMQESLSQRPQNTQSILARIDEIQQEIPTSPPLISPDIKSQRPSNSPEGKTVSQPLNNQPSSGNQQRWSWWIKNAAIASGLIVLVLILVIQDPPGKKNIPTKSPTPSPTNPLSEACDFKLGDNISCGEESMNLTNEYKEQGIDEIKKHQYDDKALELLQYAWNQSLNDKKLDPETLIYLNNLKINKLISQVKNSQKNIYTIAVVAPLKYIRLEQEFSNQGLEMLRGVAQAQDEAIKHGIYLQVVIANDLNNDKEALKIADQLGKKNLLGVIGHYSSSVALAALPKYQAYGLVLVSPASTSTDLSSHQANFYRTAPDDAASAEVIAEYLNNQRNPQKVAIFWSKGDNFSDSLKKNAEENLRKKNVNQVENSEIFNLKSDTFDATTALNKARGQGVTAIILIPDSGRSKSLTKAYEVIRANQNPNLTIIGADTLYKPETIKKVGENVARDKFVVAVSWHWLKNNKQFSNSAKKLWLTKHVSWLTATAYDATLVLTEAIKQSPSREGIKNVISRPDFKVKEGATGEISFEGSNRANLQSSLVKVLPHCNQQSDNDFVPVDYRVDDRGNCISEHE